jgi:putative pyrroloquinoline-quinone binding quinoprotein/cbb3-type cytochrome c oxidase subunit III
MKRLSGMLLLSFAAIAQSPQTARLFDQSCTSCHSETRGQGTSDATTLRQMTPEAIYDALNKGDAHAPARQLPDADRRAIGEYLSGRNFMGSNAGDASAMPNVCATNPPINSLSSTPAWNGWGVDATNGRFQPAKAAGLTADQVPRLKLKWAFGFPGATAVHGQPAVAAGRVFVGLNNGYVYALNAATGCVYWSFPARSGVRNAISIGEVKGQGTSKFAVYQDTPKDACLVCAGVAAVDLATGEKKWRRCKRRAPPNTKSPAARVSKVEGSGTLAVASTVVFGWSKTVEFTKAANEVMLNIPGINVGAAVVPVYIWGWPKSGDPSPSVQDAAVVPLKQIKNPPPFVPLKNRIKVGVIATGKVSRV